MAPGKIRDEAVGVACDERLGAPTRYALIVLLAVAMGVQNSMARRVAVPDLTTTVVTLTLTGLVSDSTSGVSSRPGRRVVAS